MFLSLNKHISSGSREPRLPSEKAESVFSEAVDEPESCRRFLVAEGALQEKEFDN